MAAEKLRVMKRATKIFRETAVWISNIKLQREAATSRKHEFDAAQPQRLCNSFGELCFEIFSIL